MGKIRKEAREAFDKAILQGRLTVNPKAKNYAGKYMYMGKTPYTCFKGQYDSFKNIATRQYDV